MARSRPRRGPPLPKREKETAQGVDEREPSSRPGRGSWARDSAHHCRGRDPRPLGITDFFFFSKINFYKYFLPFFIHFSNLNPNFSIIFNFYKMHGGDDFPGYGDSGFGNFSSSQPWRSSLTPLQTTCGVRNRRRRGNRHPNTGVSPHLIRRGTWVVPNRGSATTGPIWTRSTTLLSNSNPPNFITPNPLYLNLIDSRWNNLWGHHQTPRHPALRIW